MTTLTIQDLPVTEELDRQTMSAMRGGMSFLFPGIDITKFESSFSTQQLIGQTQNTVNQNGVGVAFGGNMMSNVMPKQEAQNISTVNLGASPVLS
jgi:hypothetical protein